MSFNGENWDKVAAEAVVRSCSVKNVFKKYCEIHRKTPLLESLFNKAASLKARKFIQKRLQQRRVPVNFEEKFKNSHFAENLRAAVPFFSTNNVSEKISRAKS